MHLNRLLKNEWLTLVVFICITIPLIIHTQQLLLRVTNFETEIPYMAEVYALFFAIAFDTSVFLFSINRMEKAMKTFAWIVFLINFLFFNLDILFVALPASGNTASEVAQLVIGTLFSGVGAFLVYQCSEMLNKRISEKEADARRTVKPARKMQVNPVSKAKTPATTHESKALAFSPVPGPVAKSNGDHRDHEVSDGSPRDEKEKVLALYKKGFSYREISEQVSVGKSTVAKWIKLTEV